MFNLIKKMNANPLVSIVVISYNSAIYILETLESCKYQTYSNIELVISDDASTDNTVEICEKWLSRNGDRFKGAKIIEGDKNTGISPNLNRGVHGAEGVWIKIIAGDDILLSNCVADYMEYIHEIVNNGNKVELLASRTIRFKTDKQDNKIEVHDKPSHLYLNNSLNHEDQYELTLRSVSVSVISIFFLRDRFLEIGGCDERFPMYEDKPLLFNYLLKGTKVYFLNKFTIMRRMHDESITGKSELIVSSWKINSFYPVHYEYVYHGLTLPEKIVFVYEYYVDTIIFKLKLKKKVFYHKIVSRILRLPAIAFKPISRKMIINKYS